MMQASPLSRAPPVEDHPGMPSTTSSRELAHRSGDGIDVWLMWHPGTDSVSVRVSDVKAGANFEIPVKARHRAMDVFQHPFAYAT
jgi:hypothetical protein